MTSTSKSAWNRPQGVNLLLSDNDGMDSLHDEHALRKITGQSLAGIRRDRQMGRGCPFVKVGALVRYRRSDIVNYLAALPAGKSTVRTPAEQKGANHGA